VLKFFAINLSSTDIGGNEVKLSLRKEKVQVLTPRPEEDRWFFGEQLTNVATQMRIQAENLRRTADNLSDRGKTMFEKCVRAQQERDMSRAAMYANEVAQQRKMCRLILKSQLALEQVILRLETVREFGDIAKVLGPATNIVLQVQAEIGGLVPEVSMGLSRIDEMLASLMVEAGSVAGETLAVRVGDEEAQNILREASEIAAQRLKSSWPELPERRGVPELEPTNR